MASSTRILFFPPRSQMDHDSLVKSLSDLPIGSLRYFNSIGSTNDEALEWVSQGAPDLSIVIANEQTAGRGRLDRQWFTPVSTALAVSLIMRPSQDEIPFLSRTVGLAALSLADAFGMLGLAPQIKWPNDILLNDRKVAGILIETAWAGDEVDYLVVGMGVNVARASVPLADKLSYPAISLEHILGAAPNRVRLLHSILASFISLRTHLRSDSFISIWERSLAFHDREVRIEAGNREELIGRVAGLESDGSLKLINENGKTVTVRFGDVRLRLVS